VRGGRRRWVVALFRQHVLAVGDVWQDSVDEVCSQIGGSPGPATGTDSRLAGEPYEPLFSTRRAAYAGEASHRHDIVRALGYMDVRFGVRSDGFILPNDERRCDRWNTDQFRIDGGLKRRFETGPIDWSQE